MKEVVTMPLENEMDLLLANRRAMKLAEHCGLSLTLQTGLGTAVSEIARTALSIDKDTFLKLGVTELRPNTKAVTAIVCNTVEACWQSEAFGFAKRLIPGMSVVKGSGGSCDIRMDLEIKHGNLITESKIASFIEYFRTEPPLSPYDEVRRKSIQLLEFSRKLEESEGQYRQLADTLPIMMVVSDPSGRVVYTNRWLRNCLVNSLITITPPSIKAITHPDDQLSVSKGWHAAFSCGLAFTAEARLA